MIYLASAVDPVMALCGRLSRVYAGPPTNAGKSELRSLEENT